MANSQARDGRQSLAFIAGDKVAVSGSVAVGDFIVVTAKSASSSAFKDYPLNKPFFAMKAFSVGEGDTVYKMPLYFLGQATGKSVSHSKNTTDVTIDYDAATNNVTDGIVSTSGSISGSFITEDVAGDSGINLLKSRFRPLMQIDDTGAVTVQEANTDEKDILVIGWNLRNAKAGDLLEVDVIPALITGLSIGGEYGSSQSFDIDFTGNATDENNFEGSTLQIEATDDFLKTISLARPAV